MLTLLVRRLALVLLVVGILCRGAAAQLYDVELGHFALACIGLGVAALLATGHRRLERWIEVPS